MRTSAEARLRNRRDRSQCRVIEKQVLGIQAKSEGITALSRAFELLDHMAIKGVIHKNTAARHKAKLTRHVNGLQA